MPVECQCHHFLQPAVLLPPDLTNTEKKAWGVGVVNEGEKKRVNQGDKIWSLEVDGWVANSSSYSGLHDNTPFSLLLSLPPSFGFFWLYLIFPSSSCSSFSVELCSSLPFVLPQLSDELQLLIYESLHFLLLFECEFVKCVFFAAARRNTQNLNDVSLPLAPRLLLPILSFVLFSFISHSVADGQLARRTVVQQVKKPFTFTLSCLLLLWLHLFLSN